jgi:hypothetical protein
VQFQAEHVLDVEDVHHLRAIGRDDRMGDIDVGRRERLGQIIEQAGPVAGVDLDDRVDLRALVVEGDMRRHVEGPFAFLDLVAARPARGRR